MPFVKIDLWKGRSKEQVKNLIKKITDAVVETVGCPPGAVHVVINEVEKDNWGISGKPASEIHPDT